MSAGYLPTVNTGDAAGGFTQATTGIGVLPLPIAAESGQATSGLGVIPKLSVDGGNSIVLTAPVPALYAADTNDAALTAPAPALDSGTNGAVVSAPAPVLDSGSNGVDISAAPPTLFTGNVESTCDMSAGTPTLTATVLTGEVGSVSAYAGTPTLDSSVLTGEVGTVNISGGLPLLDATSVESPYVSITAPAPTLEIEAAPEAGTLTGIAGAPTLYAYSLAGQVAAIDITAPAPLAELRWWSADLAAPVPTLSATSLTGEIITVTAAAGTPILSADAINPAIITADMAALPPQLNAAIAAGNVAAAALLARAPQVQAQVLTGEVGTAVLSAATPIMAAAGYPAYTVTFAGVAPAPYLGATVSAVLSENYRTWVLNTRTGALTEYDTFAFNSYTVFNGKVIAAGATGLVEVGLQATDAGLPINSTATTGQESFGSSVHKRVPRVYTSYSADGDMRFSTITTEGGTRTYALNWNSLHGTQQRRVPVGKGPKSRFWAFSMANVDGADFSINDVLVMPTHLRRRVM